MSKKTNDIIDLSLGARITDSPEESLLRGMRWAEGRAITVMLISKATDKFRKVMLEDILAQADANV